MQTVNLHGVFSSIQGEGLWVGYPQVFVRFSGCNLKCRYCDTPEAQAPKAYAQIETTPFSCKFKAVRNPINTGFLTKQIRKTLNYFPGFHSVSLTGGEPLLHAAFLAEWLPRIKQKRMRIFLETNGTLPDELKRIIKWIDIISMDIKTADTTGVSIDWNKTRQFLKLAARKEVYAKILIGQKIKPTELIRARKLIASVNRSIPVVLQPITPRQAKTVSLNLKSLMQGYRIMARQLKDVKIIPQMHKIMGWL